MTPILAINYGTPATDEYVGITSFSTQNSWDTGGGPSQRPGDTNSGNDETQNHWHP